MTTRILQPRSVTTLDRPAEPAVVRACRRGAAEGGLPRVSFLWVRWFRAYTRRYLRRHFHAVRLSKRGAPLCDESVPLVVYANHPSWWDPLIGFFLAEQFFPSRTLYAPIDATALRRYGILKKLGFFGVERDTRRGAVAFLDAARAATHSASRLLMLTPQGRFSDPRERPIRFQSGLGHIAARSTGVTFVPLALEYPFWEERLPEALVRFGDPIRVEADHARVFEPAYWSGLFEQRLTETCDALAVEAQLGRREMFEVLLRGRAGQGGVYDWWRTVKAGWARKPFRKEHGKL